MPSFSAIEHLIFKLIVNIKPVRMYEQQGINHIFLVCEIVSISYGIYWFCRIFLKMPFDFHVLSC